MQPPVMQLPPWLHCGLTPLLQPQIPPPPVCAIHAGWLQSFWQLPHIPPVFPHSFDVVPLAHTYVAPDLAQHPPLHGFAEPHPVPHAPLSSHASPASHSVAVVQGPQVPVDAPQMGDVPVQVVQAPPVWPHAPVIVPGWQDPPPQQPPLHGPASPHAIVQVCDVGEHA